MDAVPITPRLHALRIPFQVPLAPDRALSRFVYAWLGLGERVLLVDSGVAGAEAAILGALAACSRPPGDAEALILTHAHPDHIGAAAALRAATGCRVLAHTAECRWIEDTALQKRERPVPGFDALVAGPVTVDETLRHGRCLDWPGLGSVRILHTPGHSPGSISLFLEAEGVLITGDAVPQADAMPIYTDVADSARSLRLLLDLPGVEVLCASWDEPRRGPAAESALRAGLAYLRTVHVAVRRAVEQSAAGDPLALCRSVVAALALPPFAANPLVAISIEAHRRVLGDPCVDALLDPDV